MHAMKKRFLLKPCPTIMAKLLQDEAELQRLHALNTFERAARLQGFVNVAGIDEAGRGPLAGPVVAAACLIPADLFIAGIDDSKKLSPKKRFDLFSQLTSNTQIKFGVGIISSTQIDAINIYQATIMAMLQAVANLSCNLDFLLVDGLHLPHPSIPTQKIIQGDQKSQSSAAASIIAKETRDSLMKEYHQEWPHYGLKSIKDMALQNTWRLLQSMAPAQSIAFLSSLSELVLEFMDGNGRKWTIMDVAQGLF